MVAIQYESAYCFEQEYQSLGGVHLFFRSTSEDMKRSWNEALSHPILTTGYHTHSSTNQRHIRNAMLNSTNPHQHTHATFLPTLPTPRPTTLTTTSSRPSPPASRNPHPLPPKAFESRASCITSSLANTSFPSATRPTSSEPIAMSINTVGAAARSTQPP